MSLPAVLARISELSGLPPQAAAPTAAPAAAFAPALQGAVGSMDRTLMAGPAAPVTGGTPAGT